MKIIWNWSHFLPIVLSRLYKAIIIVLTIINIIIIGFYIAIWIGSASEKLFSGSDFYSIFNTIVTMKTGYSGIFIKSDIMSLFKNGILGGLVDNGVYLLQYPPFVALIFLPLSFLPFNIAFYIWTLAQVGLLICIIYIFNRLLFDWYKQERLFMTVTLLAFWPLAITFILGQFSLVILFIIVQLYMALSNSKKLTAGIWLALMIIKPQTVLIPGIISIQKRYIRTAVSFIFTSITIVLITTIIFGFRSWYKYTQLILSSSHQFENFGFAPKIEYTLRGLLTGIFGNSQSQLINIISIIFLFFGILSAWFLWLKDIPPDSPSFKLRFSFIISLSVFLSLHLYPHDSLILVLPAALFYDFLRQNNYPRKLYVLLILSSPFIFFFGAFNSYNLFGVIRPPLVAIIALLLYMSCYLILDIQKSFQNTNTLLV